LQVKQPSGLKASCGSFFSDGSRFVTGYRDGAVRVWSAVDGKPISNPSALEAEITAINISPDETLLAAGAANGTVGLFSASGRLIRLLKGHTDRINSVHFSPNSIELITASRDNTVRVWRSDGTELNEIRSHRSVDMASFSPDGTRVLVVSSDTVSIFEKATGESILTLKGHPEAHSAAFSADGSRVVTSSLDGQVRVWDAKTGQLIQFLGTGESGMALAIFAPDGAQIVTRSANTVTLWGSPAGSRNVVKQLRAAPDDWTAVSPDHSKIAVTSGDGDITVFGLSLRPVVQDLTSASNGTLWAVGSRGYVATSEDGLSFSRIPSSNSLDLIAVAPIGPEGAIALGSDNSLTHWSAAVRPANVVQPTNVVQPPNAVRPSKVQATGPGSASVQGIQQNRPPAPLAGSGAEFIRPPDVVGTRKLRALSFATELEGWVAGDDGLVLHTTDHGSRWTPLYGQSGLAIADMVVEPSGVAWALGKYDDGRLAVVAANKAAAAEGPDGWHQLPHYVGPWYFFLGIPVFLLAAFFVLASWRPDPEVPPKSIEEVANSDSPLRWNDPEAGVLKPLARGLSRFLRNVNTKPPLTLAITGRWGSGKSSLMNLLMSDLQAYGSRAVWFNAWHHREEEHLLAALFQTIRAEAPPGWWSWPGFAFRARLMWRRTWRTLLNLLYAALFAGIVILTVREALPAFHVEETNRMLNSLIELAGLEAQKTWTAILASALAGSGGIAVLGLWLRGKLVALPANPAKLVSALSRRASLTDFSDKLAFRHKFGEQFGDVCNALLTRQSAGLVILIDDLDRCQPEDILKVLEAVNYLVSAGPCTLVLGMDRRQIEYCVGLGFEKLVEGLPEEELIYAADETPDKSGKQRAFARHYLEKLINIEVPVPTLDETSTGAMLSGANKVDEEDPPRWLNGLKRAAASTYQIARVGLMAFIIGIFVTWGVERLREVKPTAATSLVEVVKSRAKEAGKAEVATGDINADPAARTGDTPGFVPARVDVPRSPPSQEIPSSRRWLWWSPTILIVGLAALFGIGAAAQRRRQIVEDSPAFSTALQAVNPLFAALSVTPRGIKRYQNRMRYLAARMRPARYEPDAVDAGLNWLGKRLGRSLVPAAWFRTPEQDRLTIAEPALIVLGAIEVIAPSAFGSTAELYSILDNGAPRDWLTDRLASAWTRVRTAFANEGLPMPTLVEFARYATFVQSKTRAPSSHPADVIPLHPTSGPRSA
jgi:WD40 repeat protein